MSPVRILAVSVLASTLATSAIAEEKIKDTLYLTPSAAFGLFDHKNDVSETIYYQLGAQYRFLPNWAVEGVYGRGRADWDNKNPGHRNYRDARLDGLYYFNNNRGVQPYIATGLGRSKMDKDDQTRMNLGGGMRYVVDDNVSFNVEGREFFGFDHDTFDTQASVGVSWAFNRRHEPAPAPIVVAVAPAPVVPAPLPPADSDKDGVPNDRDLCPQTRPGAKVNAKGCEGKKATLETIRLNVKFATASDEIGPNYDNEIRKVADFLRKFPDTSVEIEGHTDSTGGYEMNKDLSNRRANSVRERLIKHHGIDASRVTSVGYGPDKPVASNDTVGGRAQNRRVDARMEKVVE